MANENIYTAHSIVNFGSVVGSVTGCFKDIMLSKFPKNFFKEVKITTEHQAFSEEDGEHDLAQYRKVSPAISIDPDVTTEEPLGATIHQDVNFRRFSNELNAIRRYTPVFRDVDGGINMYSQMSRVKLSFNVEIRVDTTMQAWNVRQFLNGNFVKGRYFYQDKEPIGIAVPSPLIRHLARAKGSDLTTPVGAEEFIAYLKRYSPFHFSDIINNSTGNSIINMTYLANILFKLEDTPSVEKGEKNRSNADSKITCTFTAEINFPFRFALITHEDIDTSTLMEFDKDIDSHGDNIVTNQLLRYGPPDIVDGKTQFMSKRFLTTPDDFAVNDSLPFKSIFSQIVINYIDSVEEVVLEDFFVMKVWYGNSEMTESDFSVDWKNGVLTLINPFINGVYHFAVYGDITEIHKFQNETVFSMTERMNTLEGI
jgi:hypothetical protein